MLASDLESRGLTPLRIQSFEELAQQGHPLGIVQDAFAIEQGNQFSDDFPQFVISTVRGFSLYRRVRRQRRGHFFTAQFIQPRTKHMKLSRFSRGEENAHAHPHL